MEHDYEAIYRRLHPRQFPHSPRERQMELKDLWVIDQVRFKRMIDAILGGNHAE